MPWQRRRYRGNKVWVRVTDAEEAVLDGRGLAQVRYKVDDERTYTVRPAEIEALEEPEPLQPDPADAAAEAIEIHTDGASSGNPGPAGIGVVLCWRGRRREIARALGTATNNVAELTAILEALRAVKRPELPVRLHTDSAYAIGVLVEGHRVKQNAELVEAIRGEMARFADLAFVKVAAHAGVPENERADRLARDALRGA